MTQTYFSAVSNGNLFAQTYFSVTIPTDQRFNDNEKLLVHNLI